MPSVTSFPSNYLVLRGVPSNFIPYSFNRLAVRSFHWHELVILHKIRMTKDMELLVNLINSCIDVDAGELILEDFEFLMHYLKINSFPKSPLGVTWDCKYCGHNNFHRVLTTKTEINEIPKGYTLPDNIDYPRMKHYVQLEEESIDNPERKELLDIAIWVAGDELKEKIELLNLQTNIELYNKIKKVKAELQFGVQQSTNVACMKCDKPRTIIIKLPMMEFFSNYSAQDLYTIEWRLAQHCNLQATPNNDAVQVLAWYNLLRDEQMKKKNKSGSSPKTVAGVLSGGK